MERRLVRRCGRACRRVGRHISMPIVSCLLPSRVPYVDGAAICTACLYLYLIRSVSFSGIPLRGKGEQVREHRGNRLRCASAPTASSRWVATISMKCAKSSQGAHCAMAFRHPVCFSGRGMSPSLPAAATAKLPGRGLKVEKQTGRGDEKQPGADSSGHSPQAKFGEQRHRRSTIICP